LRLCLCLRKKGKPGVIGIVVRFKTSTGQRHGRHGHKETGMFAGARGLASDHFACLLAITDQIRSVIPEEKEEKRNCKFVHSPSHSPRQLKPMKCNTGPLIKLARK
jgi:hypothetical protein